MFIFIIKRLVVIHSSHKNVYINRLSSSCVKVAMRAFGFCLAFLSSQSLHDGTGMHKQNMDVVAINRNDNLFPNIRAFVALSEPIQTPVPSVRAQYVLQR